VSAVTSHYSAYSVSTVCGRQNCRMIRAVLLSLRIRGSCQLIVLLTLCTLATLAPACLTLPHLPPPPAWLLAPQLVHVALCVNNVYLWACIIAVIPAYARSLCQSRREVGASVRAAVTLLTDPSILITVIAVFDRVTMHVALLMMTWYRYCLFYSHAFLLPPFLLDPQHEPPSRAELYSRPM